MVSNHDASIVYFDESPVLFSTIAVQAPNPTQLPRSNSEDMESIPIAYWGIENTFPLQARQAKEANPDLVSALDWKARALYGGGLNYVIRDRYTKEPINSPEQYREIRKIMYEVDQFKYLNRHYLLRAVIDFYDLFNVFPQLILKDDRSKITRIAALEAQDCRYEKRNKSGIVEKVWLHPDWDDWMGTENDEKVTKIPALNPLITHPDEIRDRRGDTLRYVFPLSYPTGKNYYQLVHWWSIKVSGWLDFGRMIPEVKATILKNIALIRYHIQMPDYWMPERYENWRNMTPEDQMKATKKEYKIINDVLIGSQNAGKSIFTTFKTMQGKEYAGWKVEAVDDKMKDGALLADSSEATIKVFSGTSIDPSLHGLIPGAGGSNRSGSDKREALNIYMSLITSHEDIILDPFQFASWYNQWNNADIECHWYMNKPILQTLNAVSPANRSTAIPEPDAD